jgi:predicted metal-dependent hydrolase
MSAPSLRAASGPDPAAYAVRESTRARRVILRIDPGRGLCVVVPRGFDAARVPDIVEQRRAWIERTLDRLAGEGFSPSAGPPVPPASLELRAVGQVVAVDFLPARGRVRLVENAGRLLLAADPAEPARWARALRGFVLTRARGVLPAWLAQASRETGLAFASVRVRHMRTRWGSCSRRGVVNLNARLLFLPRELVFQVLVHELCHIRRPDHSRRFWDLVAAKRPGYEPLERELRLAARYVPAWLEA